MYFAYGSNIDRAQMMRRCPASGCAGEAWLDGWRLVFAGWSVTRRGPVATLVQDPAASTPGLLFRMHLKDSRTLDRCEGAAYRRHRVHVDAGGRRRRAFTYIMGDQPLGVPPIAYVGQIVAASLRERLPVEHLLPWLEQSLIDNDVTSLRNMDAAELLAHMRGTRRERVRQKNLNKSSRLQMRLWNYERTERESDYMRGRKSELTEMIAEDPAQARQELIVQLVASGGNISATARALGISRRSTHRYVEQLGLGHDVSRLRAERRSA